jgi:hypothetical protein
MAATHKKKSRASKISKTSRFVREKSVLLEELGRSPDEYPIFSLPSPLLPWGAVVAGILFIIFAPALIKDGPVGALLAAALALALFAILLLPRKLLLGQDGLLLVWILGSRFIPFRNIESVEMTDGVLIHHPAINLILKSGQALTFTTSIFKERWAARDALIRLLRTYVEAARSKKPPQVRHVLLRAGKPHDVWARTLLAMGHGAHFDPRTPAVHPDELLRIAEDADVSLVERTAAFVALSGLQDAAFTKRLRIALDETVAPVARSTLRDALEAGGDETRVAEVLEQAEKTSAAKG